MRGLIHLYIGDGKGKTTAGVGLAVRCAGSGQKVLYTQFIKNDKSSELAVLEQIENLELLRCEEYFGFTFCMTEETRKKAREFYTRHFQKTAELAKEGGFRMLVMDEVIDAYNRRFVNQQEVLDFLKNKPEELEVVMTGRDPAQELVELADYVSNVVKIKHPYDEGVVARIGIEE